MNNQCHDAATARRNGPGFRPVAAKIARDRVPDCPEHRHLVLSDRYPEGESRAEHGLVAKAEPLDQPVRKHNKRAGRQVDRNPPRAGPGVRVLDRQQTDVRPVRRDDDQQANDQ